MIKKRLKVFNNNYTITFVIVDTKIIFLYVQDKMKFFVIEATYTTASTTVTTNTTGIGMHLDYRKE